MSPRIILAVAMSLVVILILDGWDYNRAKDRCLERFSEATCINILR